MIELNDTFLKVIDLIETSSQNVFITGCAGTGKSTLLSHFRKVTRKSIAVLAPTGVAAVNVKGQTIHAFFRFKVGVTLDAIKEKKREEGRRNIYQKIDTIIIDEISMVRADLLDCVDKFLRLNGPRPHQPFGGVQMIFIGDLMQLPPIVSPLDKHIFESYYESPYFFSAHCMRGFKMERIELQKIYRQQDETYITLLNMIRHNSLTEEGLKTLNQRYDPAFMRSEDFYIYLTPTNAQAKIINETQLALLKGEEITFCGKVSGEFGRESYPTAEHLSLKTGAQIMLLNNDSNKRWINGTVGKVVQIIEGSQGKSVIIVKLENGKEVEVIPYTWEIYRFYLEEEILKSEVVGTFTQYPLALSWAITIHKSQGKTFEKVIIDMGKGAFAHGQTYVALSRCTSLHGMILTKPLSKRDIWVDARIKEFEERNFSST